MFLNKIKAGFSLIEVNMAILIAAGGMLSLFALFPVGLRQSVMSEADLHQATFASSFFEAISANVKTIDDVRVWNNIEDFWDMAVGDTGISADLLKPGNLKSAVADATGELIEEKRDETLRFVYRETADEDTSFSGAKLKLPPQMLIRVRTILNTRLASPVGTGLWPNGYSVSLVSTHEFAPAIYSHNTVYSMEFYFRKRP